MIFTAYSSSVDIHQVVIGLTDNLPKLKQKDVKASNEQGEVFRKIWKKLVIVNNAMRSELAGYDLLDSVLPFTLQ